ncbi:carboxypeptidase-like regulatory domain-containing protein [Flavobacterium piscisymbiosum]|uniref:Carboxypeptidase-like regulatory domain-containing protein n=1 Tax=Flavobacterium piscisymbiosum TaxID=2893753 RepID=A0ABS8MJ75_9FLAO|nr:carboxypeptidase-like regulatory domain-containing protein [Flavobacterium sp. F-30]MCC9065550.1 carboxypeptidase-like regulatory domain-containing protein [Flavobacterium sp. F-30]
MKAKLNLIVLLLLLCSCTNNTFSGYVYDYDSEQPIINVQIDSNGNKTETDSTGYFILKVRPNKMCKIVLRKEGYSSKKVERKPDSLGLFSKTNLKDVKIYLFEKNSDFSE